MQQELGEEALGRSDSCAGGPARARWEWRSRPQQLGSVSPKKTLSLPAKEFRADSEMELLWKCSLGLEECEIPGQPARPPGDLGWNAGN